MDLLLLLATTILRRSHPLSALFTCCHPAAVISMTFR